MGLAQINKIEEITKRRKENFNNLYNVFDFRNEFSVWNDTGRATYTLFARDVPYTDPSRIGHLNEHLLSPDWYGEPRHINMGFKLTF